MATTSNPVITIDESHPFFPHYGENLGAILVALPLVNDNYPTWAKSKQRALGVKSKLGFIDGSLSLTPAMTKIPILVQAWIRLYLGYSIVFLQRFLQVISTRTQLWKSGMISKINFLRIMDQEFSTPKGSCDNFLRRSFYHRSFMFCGMRSRITELFHVAPVVLALPQSMRN